MFWTAFLNCHKLQKIVLVVTGVATGETLERWSFDIESDKETTMNGCGPSSIAAAAFKCIGRLACAMISQAGLVASVACRPVKHYKEGKEITKEIQALLRQITASVAFLPILDEDCAFDLLLYTDKDQALGTEWEESEAKYARLLLVPLLIGCCLWPLPRATRLGAMQHCLRRGRDEARPLTRILGDTRRV